MHLHGKRVMFWSDLAQSRGGVTQNALALKKPLNLNYVPHALPEIQLLGFSSM